MIELDSKFKPVLLEALEDYLYKLSLELESFKGSPLGAERKALTEKQSAAHELQHQVSISAD